MISPSLGLHPEKIIEILKSFQDPCSGKSLVEAGLIEGVNLEKGKKIFVTLRIPSEKISQYEPLRQDITQTLSHLSGVETVWVVMTAHKGSSPSSPLPARSPALSSKLELPEIRQILAIASGKGGVGKSLTALNLALAFHKLGYKTGLLDADLYGPSLPKMIGSYDRPGVNDLKRFLPVRKFGLQCMSMGFFVPEESPLIWRGPMIQASVLQLIRDVMWEDLDLLVIDLPPGTGDTHLTLIQKVPLTGVVIVSTPQDLALVDARKALHMFQKLSVPILGFVENMSYFTCPACHHQADIFSHGGALREAGKLNVPFLGEIPLSPPLREASDEGRPLLENQEESKIFLTMAQKLQASLFLKNNRTEAP